MLKVRQHRHSAKLVKAGPNDIKREKEAVVGLLSAGAEANGSKRASSLVTENRVFRMDQEPMAAPSGTWSKSRTVVERLRDRLDYLSLRTEVPVAEPNWLPGKPCHLDTAKCAQSFSLHNTMLHVPVELLPPQVAVAERALRACDGKHIALLESPTGTGKSIALLTATLAWQRRSFAACGAAPQIVYGVRTHAQLTQIVGELSKTPYRPRMAVIGSREQLCVNEEVRALARRQQVSLDLKCRQAARRAVQPRQQRDLDECACLPYSNLGEATHAQDVFECCGSGKVWDLEDLASLARRSRGKGGCPYYTAHVLAGDADIVFCPHNYILDPSVSSCRSHHRERWSLDERVIVLDEAHNLEQGCRDAGSVQVSRRELQQLLVALRELPARHPHFRAHNLPCQEACEELRRPLQQLADFLDAQAGPHASPPQASPLGSCSRLWGLPGSPGSADFVRAANLRSVLGRRLEELAVEITDRLLRVPSPPEADVAAMGSLGRVLELLAKLRLAAEHPEAYVVGVEGAVLSAWLMSPGVVFETFASRARAVLLASGTLAPFAALDAELATSAAYTSRAQREGHLEALHVIAPTQAMVAIVTRLSNGEAAVTTFESWRRTAFLLELGDALARLAEAIPGGVLCFLPSFNALEACAAAWQSAHVWARLSSAKAAVILEPRGATALPAVTAAYAAAVRGGGGALCLAVYRGKLSEGLSFNDELCRGVVCVGVPYPQAADPVVLAKRRWNDARGGLSGDEWYELQAYRAVNQALGRCLRHCRDYGVLVLLDARWAASGLKARGLKRHLARWLRPFVEEWTADVWCGLLARLRAFFQQVPQSCAAGLRPKRALSADADPDRPLLPLLEG